MKRKDVPKKTKATPTAPLVLIWEMILVVTVACSTSGQVKDNVGIIERNSQMKTSLGQMCPLLSSIYQRTTVQKLTATLCHNYPNIKKSCSKISDLLKIEESSCFLFALKVILLVHFYPNLLWRSYLSYTIGMQSISSTFLHICFGAAD